MDFVRIGNDIIRVTNIVGFTVADGAEEEKQVVLHLQTPLGDRSSSTVTGEATEKVFEWITQRLGYLDLRPSPGHESVYLG